MRKRFFLLVLVALIGVLAACTQPTTETAPAVTPLPTRTSPALTPSPTATAPTSTPTPALVPTRTRTGTATKTPPPTPSPLPPTPTITPYPTFDLAQVTPRAPLPTAVCPVEDPDLDVVVDRSSITGSDTYVDTVWQLIDEGASLRQIAAAFDEALQAENVLPMVDLTGDNVAELIVVAGYYMIGFGCQNGEYADLLRYGMDNGWFTAGGIVSVEDMNLNGIPDVVIMYRVTTAADQVVNILEWDGTQFVSLIQANHGIDSPDTSLPARILYWYENEWWWYSDHYPGSNMLPEMNGPAEVEVRDLDGNGTLELIVTDNGPIHYDTLHSYGPWRGKQVIFTWDGLHYLYSGLEMAPPVYRFQAVQDADRYFLMGDYERALGLYQEAIFSDQLAWWSVDLRGHLDEIRYAEGHGNPTPTPIPPDPNEYPTLAAYSRYRIMLLHIARGDMESARTVYDTLLEKYPAGEVGYEYAHIAALFWTTYEGTESLALSCASVTVFIDADPSVLNALYSWYQGMQSHAYTAEDICPFK